MKHICSECGDTIIKGGSRLAKRKEKRKKGQPFKRICAGCQLLLEDKLKKEALEVKY